MSLKKGAENAVNVCMGAKKRDRILVVSDPETEAIGRALFDTAVKTSSKTALMVFPIEEGREPPEMVAKAMAASTLVLITTQTSITHTKARIKACEKGARVASMPGITEGIFSRGGLQADYLLISKRVKSMRRMLKGSREMVIRGPSGTEITLDISGRHWLGDTGLCHTPGGFTNLPAGSIFIAPVERKARGQLQFDGGIEGEEYAEVLSVENGALVEAPALKSLEPMLEKRDKCALILSRVGIGLNYRSRYTGVMIEDTKVEGNVHIGFGGNTAIGGKVRCRAFFEGIIRKPTVIIDGEVIIKTGRFVITL